MSKLWMAWVMALGAIAGCGPLVGAQCAEGYELCVDRCCPIGDSGSLDGGLDADVLMLDSGGMDAGSRDVGALDGALLDGEVPGDAGVTDAGSSDAGSSDAGSSDAGSSDAGSSDAGSSDAEVADGGASDAPGTDAGPPCDAPEVACAGICTDTMIDPEHCGACNVFCPSGLCVDGECRGSPVGHVVLIGHDYETSRIAMRRIVGNSVFLTRSSPVRVLAYVGAASTASRVGTDAAIDATATELGRAWMRTSATDVEVPTMLAGYDVLLVYAQANATDAQLAALGAAWSPAVADFLDAGGVVVVLDTMGATNDGTYQLLQAMGFATGLTGVTDVSRTTMTVVSPSDAVSLGVPSPYRGERTTVHFDGTTSGAVISDETGAPTVIHRTAP